MADKLLLNDGSSFVLLNDGTSVVLLNGPVAVGFTLSGQHATPLIGARPEQLIPVSFTFMLKAGIIFQLKTKLKVISVILHEIKSHFKLKAPLIVETKSPFKFKSTLLQPISNEESLRLRSTLLKEYQIFLKTRANKEVKRHQVKEVEKSKLKKALARLLDSLEDDE